MATSSISHTQSARAKEQPFSVAVARHSRKFLAGSMVTLFTLIFALGFLSPFGYMLVTSMKSREQLTEPGSPVLPQQTAVFTYEGVEYPVYYVPQEDGSIKEWALIGKGREESTFVDPDNVEAGEIVWEGRWRTLETATEFAPQWSNYSEAWRLLKFPLLLRNTVAIAVIGLIGTLISSIAVAYGFARFRIPGKNIIFMVLIGTIILPGFVTLVPTYALFQRIGWVGTWLPLTVPHFFSNAYNVFLLRQFFLSLPRELDEAAMIDGAGPLRILVSVILPQSIPVIISVALFHFVFAWNDFLGPLIYLSTKRDLQPISLGIQQFNALYGQQPHMIQATALLGLFIPVFIFFVAQRAFIRGIVFTGIDK